MKPYAVVETGGKQHLIRVGDWVQVEKLNAEPGQTIELGPVLAVSDGVALSVGRPHVAGAAVSAMVVRHGRARKVVSYKKKRRKGYHRKVGHRQSLTTVKVVEVRTA